MASADIVDVNEMNFEYDVLSYSQNVPVIVDFWAAWCRPCKQLSPMLELLANEAQGAFRLARLDVDQNPALALRYGVRTLPTVKAFSQGEPVAEFVGMQPEYRVREFLGRITPPSPFNLAVERAEGLYAMGNLAEAEKMFHFLLDQSPGNPNCLFGLACIQLRTGRLLDALNILRHFPASRLYPRAELLLPYAELLVDLDFNKLPLSTDLDAAFQNSLRLAIRDNLPAALDGLLDVLRQDKRYQKGRARQAVLGILELLHPEDPITRQYRSELASILF